MVLIAGLHLSDVPREQLCFGIEVPPCVVVACVVRAMTGSPGLLRFESTGLVRTALTDEPLASLSPERRCSMAASDSGPMMHAP